MIVFDLAQGARRHIQHTREFRLRKGPANPILPDTVADAKLSGRDPVEKADRFFGDPVMEKVVQDAGRPVLSLLKLQLEKVLLRVPESDDHLGNVRQIGQKGVRVRLLFQGPVRKCD